ncbi:MAG: hypothetical protein ACYS9X_17650, partial [Planctomycetota bacterium]
MVNSDSSHRETPPPSTSLLLDLRRKYNALEEDARGLRAILKLSRDVSRHLELDEVLATAMKSAVHLTGADRGYLVLAEGDGDLRVRASHRLEAAAIAVDD